MEGGDEGGERDAFPEHAGPAASRLGRVPRLGPIDGASRGGRDRQGGATAGPRGDGGLVVRVEAVCVIGRYVAV